MACSSCGDNPLTRRQITALYGAPLSSACARSHSGSIPRVFRYAGFTQVEGQIVEGGATPGGFEPASLCNSFWKGTPGCFGGDNDRYDVCPDC